MANSYDIATVVSRSYISEQMQDNMQKGAEQRNAHFIAEFQKEAEKKNRSVQKTEKTENPVISDKVMRATEDEKEKKRREKKESMKKKNSETTNKIDFTV